MLIASLHLALKRMMRMRAKQSKGPWNTGENGLKVRSIDRLNTQRLAVEISGRKCIFRTFEYFENFDDFRSGREVRRAGNFCIASHPHNLSTLEV